MPVVLVIATGGRFTGQSGELVATLTPTSIKDVPFDDLVVLVGKLDRLKEAGVLVDAKGNLARARNRN